MNRILIRLGTVGAGVTLALSGIAGLSASAQSPTSSASDPSTYIAPLHQLNHSGVSGIANLSINDTQPGAALTAQVRARGTEPNQIHAIHIHGMLDSSSAECPTTSADTNRDNLVSVFEGAPFYGPIKVSFTDPPTTFGPPSRTDLFAPFAGIPTFANFPHSNSNGRVLYGQTIPFDMNNQYAVQALSSLTPLSQQHIVIHGGFAPESVDTPGGNPNKIVYDALLPVACGPIIQTHQGSTDNQGQNNSGEGSISNTGPGSTNTITETSNNSVTVTNNNNVEASNQSTQSSSTGNGNVTENTNSGTSSTGSSTNSNNSGFMFRIMNKTSQN